ncbi:hypothetical protein BDZ94DRAFT_552627 [Collybia nuda]|uniref:C2H2-type domain-containing protein n=1 Tax=Collybia nuda TaxID=64659 RepID=A0A9P6CQS1_9AGAR|nr:hypothetical protein BDZ94DRAFT_552627 [Collybia nuda]
MSTYLQCSTLRTPHTHISNLPQPALAPNDVLSTSFKVSPLLPAASHSYLQGYHFEVNDFQSNARVKDHINTKSPSPLLSGLGIYTDLAYSYNLNRKETSPAPGSPSFRFFPQPQSSDARVLTQPNDTLHAVESFLFLDPHLPESWSTYSNISSSTDDTLAQALDPMDGLSLCYPLVDDPCHWSFDSLSAASGISVGLLAEQISAAADLALQQISSISADHVSPSGVLGNSFSRNNTQSPLWPMLPCDKNEISTVPGTNIYQYHAQSNGNSIGINPIEVMGDLDKTYKQESHLDQTFESYPPSVSAVSHLSSLFSSGSFFMGSSHVSSDSHVSHLSSLPSSMLFPSDESAQDYPLESILEVSAEIHVDIKDKAQAVKPQDTLKSAKFPGDDENSDYEPPPCQGLSSKESSPFPSPRQKKRKRPSKKGDTKPINKVPRISSDTIGTHIIRTEDLDIDLGTPVFDAHKGVSLMELKAKAQRYCLRNPGKEYDRRWLILFAGKLSAQGELISDFRCYVAGCTQLNKRRDHILIHVGGHLDQRPFGCIHCPARFLRRNECKRHEVSHSGVRPYVCRDCPYGATGTTFVRQDLLRRHVQRKHPHVNVREGTKKAQGSGLRNIGTRAQG